jgi:hypothetical protein
MNARLWSRPWMAHTQAEYARMLIARGEPGDREKARDLLGHATQTARELGMKALLDRAAALGRSPVASGRDELEASAEVPASRVIVFRREGEFWTIADGGTVARLRDAKGLRYLARLLGHPGREFYAATWSPRRAARRPPTSSATPDRSSTSNRPTRTASGWSSSANRSRKPKPTTTLARPPRHRRRSTSFCGSSRTRSDSVAGGGEPARRRSARAWWSRRRSGPPSGRSSRAPRGSVVSSHAPSGRVRSAPIAPIRTLRSTGRSSAVGSRPARRGHTVPPNFTPRVT